MKHYGLVMMVWLLFMFPPGASQAASSQAGISLRSPAHHAVLYETSNWYDMATETAEVSGFLRGFPPAAFQSGQLGVLLNGTQWLNVQMQGGSLAFSGNLRLPMPKGRWVLVEASVEVVDMVTNEVKARDWSTFFDLRIDGTPPFNLGIQPFHTGDRVDSAIAAQLTDAGIGNPGPQDVLGALEFPHRASLPYPDPAAFDAAIGTAFRASPERDALEDVGEVCFNVEYAEEDRFASQTAFLPLAEAMAVAEAIHLAFETAQEYVENGVASLAISVPGVGTAAGFVITLASELVAKSVCASKPPKIEDFKVCVSDFHGRPSNLAVGPVDDVDLFFGAGDPAAGGVISSEVRLVDVRGDIDADLRGLSVKWRDSSCLDVFPGITVDERYIEQTDWLAEWSTCDDMAVTADAVASIAPTQFAIDRRARNRERLDVTRTSSGSFELQGVQQDRGNNACSEAWIEDETGILLDGYESDILEIVSEEWDRGSGISMQQALALEDLLTPLEIGNVPHPAYDLHADLRPIETLPISGMTLGWDTRVEMFDGQAKSLQPSTWFYYPRPDFLPWHPEGDVDGARFDLSYSLSTAYLNQLVRAHTGLMHIDYQPGWEELAAISNDATPSQVGQSADDAPVFNAALLNAILPEAQGMFSELGTRTLEIRLTPTLTPLVWMSPDLSVNDMTTIGFPLHYGMADLEVSFAEPAQVDKTTGAIIEPEVPWLVLTINFIDDDFSISYRSDATLPYLEADFGLDLWATNVRRNKFSSCPMFTHATLAQPVASCERDLEAAVGGLFTPILRSILLEALSEIPVPMRFDAEGHAGVPLLADKIRQWQINQHVSFYFDLPDPLLPE